MKKYNYLTLEQIESKGRQFPGAFKISSVFLEGETTTTDITEDVANITVHESLQSAFLFGSIVINDIKNTILQKRIFGNEILRFSITDGVMKTDLRFRCYRIGDRVKTNPQSERFTLNFCSFELFTSQYTRICKSFMNEKAEDVIRELFKESGNELDEKKYHFDETIAKLCCIIPNWDLARACNFVAGRSVSKYIELQSNNFLFFQTIDGVFNFFPLEGLMDNTRNVVFCDMMFDPMRRKQTVSHDESNLNRVVSFEELNIVNSIDHIANINNGMYSNRASVIDISKREIIDQDYDYLKEFEENNIHTKAYQSKSKPLLSAGSDLSRKPTAFWFPVITSKSLYTDETDDYLYLTKNVHKKISKNAQIESFVLEGTLPGHLGIMAGHLINLHLPYRPYPPTPGGAQSIDPILSGEWLVKSVTRVFTLNKFEMRVQLVKDSIGIKLGSDSERGR